MTKQELTDLVEQGHEIEFEYAGKRYSITYYAPEGKTLISFCEFYKEVTDVETVDELCEIKRNGVRVIEMLSSVSDDDIEIY